MMTTKRMVLNGEYERLPWTLEGNTVALDVLRIVSENDCITGDEICAERHNIQNWRTNREIIEMTAAGLIKAERIIGTKINGYYISKQGEIALREHDRAQLEDMKLVTPTSWLLAGWGAFILIVGFAVFMTSK